MAFGRSVFAIAGLAQRESLRRGGLSLATGGSNLAAHTNSHFNSRLFSVKTRADKYLVKGADAKSFMEAEKDIARLQQEVKEFFTRGQFKEALSVAYATKDAVKVHFGEQHPVYASSLNNVAIMLKNLGENEDALNAYREALQTYGDVVGKDHAGYVTCLHNIGLLLKTMAEMSKGLERANHLEEAVIVLTEVLEKRKKMLRENHPDLALTSSCLGGVYRLKGELPRARELLESSLAALDGALGPRHVASATAANNLALLLKSLPPPPATPAAEHAAAMVRARGLYERSLDTRRELLGPAHQDTIVSMHNLAELHLAAGRTDEAEALQQEIMRLLPPPPAEDTESDDGATGESDGIGGGREAAGEGGRGTVVSSSRSRQAPAVEAAPAPSKADSPAADTEAEGAGDDGPAGRLAAAVAATDPAHRAPASSAFPWEAKRREWERRFVAEHGGADAGAAGEVAADEGEGAAGRGGGAGGGRPPPSPGPPRREG